MRRLVGNWHRLLCTVTIAMTLTGCGGGSARSASQNPPSDNPGEDPPQVVIEGVATPNSVAVVTATNAD